VLDDQLSDLDVGGMGRSCLVDVEKYSVAVELRSVYAFLDLSVQNPRFCCIQEHRDHQTIDGDKFQFFGQINSGTVGPQ
jgi:hypothetical protein